MVDGPVADGFPEDVPTRGTDDAFGRMVWDVHRGTYAGSAVSRSWRGGGHDAMPRMYFGEESAPETRTALELVAATAGDRPVADVGCGPGKYALELESRGVDAIGVDPSALALRTAREQGVQRVLAGDLNTLGLTTDAVDAVFMCGTQLGVAGTVAGLRAVLNDLDRIVAPGGRVVADLTDPTEQAAMLASEGIRHTETDDLVRVDEDRGVGRRRMRTEYDGAVGPWIDLLLLSPAAAERAVEPTTWRLVETPGAGGSRYYLHLER